MVVQHYNALKTLIEQSSIGVKKVDWYNQQYIRYKELKANRFPAAYIEFPNTITWNELGNKVQKAEVTIYIHLVVFDVKDELTPTMEKARDLNKDLTGKALFDGVEQLSNKMYRSFSETILKYDQLKIIKQGYNCTIYDCTAVDDLQNPNQFSIP